MLDADGGDLGQAQKLGGQDAAMTCDHVALTVRDDGHEKAKAVDASRDLANLTGTVNSRVEAIERQVRNSAINDFDRGFAAVLVSALAILNHHADLAFHPFGFERSRLKF